MPGKLASCGLQDATGDPPPDPVLFQTDGQVGTIQLNRLDCRNAVDGPTAAALLGAFERFEADDALRVAVLVGTGGHFCAGRT